VSPGGGPPAINDSPGMNESCVSNGETLTCVDGLICISSNDADDVPIFGACKAYCTSDLDCTTGSCMLGILGDGQGFCGNAMVAGQGTCELWETGDNVCFNANDTNGANDAFLECLNGTCGYVCNYTGNAEDAMTCPQNGSCGVSMDTYTGYSIDLAVCE